jgi:hypothetical protein
VAKFSHRPRSSHLPFAHHGLLGHPADFRCLSGAQTPKDFQCNDLAITRIDAFPLLQHGIPIAVQPKRMRHTDIGAPMNIYGDVVTDEMTIAGARVAQLAFKTIGAQTERAAS